LSKDKSDEVIIESVNGGGSENSGFGEFFSNSLFTVEFSRKIHGWGVGGSSSGREVEESEDTGVLLAGSSDSLGNFNIGIFEIFHFSDIMSGTNEVDDDVRVGDDSINHLEIIKIHMLNNKGLTQVCAEL